MPDRVFETRNLVAAINAMRPVKTPVLDKVFALKEKSLSSYIEFDVEKDSEGVQVSVPSGSPANVINKDGFDTVVVPAPRFPEKVSIKPSDLDRIRKMGSEAPAVLADLVGRNLANLRARTDRTREFMAIKALSGTVVDGSGTTLVTYTFPTGHTPVLTGNDKWDNSASNPLGNLRSWKKKITAATGGAVEQFCAFCASDVMDAILAHEKIRDLLKNIAGKDIAENGRIGKLAGIEIEEVLGTYKSSGTRTDMMPSGYIAVVGIGYGNTSECYAPPEDFEAPDGIGSGKNPNVFFAKSWDEKDPSVKWIKAEARPLPVIKRPGCIVYAKVL